MNISILCEYFSHIMNFVLDKIDFFENNILLLFEIINKTIRR